MFANGTYLTGVSQSGEGHVTCLEGEVDAAQQHAPFQRVQNQHPHHVQSRRARHGLGDDVSGRQRLSTNQQRAVAKFINSMQRRLSIWWEISLKYGKITLIMVGVLSKIGLKETTVVARFYGRSL